eukprot:9269368-Alexandrium_andersonii.AAC.1
MQCRFWQVWRVGHSAMFGMPGDAFYASRCVSCFAHAELRFDVEHYCAEGQPSRAGRRGRGWQWQG